MSDPTNPFSDANIAKAEAPVENLPQNQVQGGITYSSADGIGAEVEGEKDLGTKGIFIAGDVTYSQRAKWGAALLLGWKPK